MNHDDSQSTSFIQRFIHSEVTGSMVLLACTVVAMLWANSSWAESYVELIHTHVALSWGDSRLDMSLQHWINDLIMVVFFFVVGLEIKREVLVGRLSSMKKAALPVAAAFGGMIVPAALYIYFNQTGEALRGWGIPMATDIAFSLGVLALLGNRVPLSLKVFLTAFAIADDLGAVLVIALFYTEAIRWGALLAAAVLLLLLFVTDRARLRRPSITALIIAGIWASVFASGIHATVAGILVAMVLPVRSRIDPRSFMALADRNLKELNETDLNSESLLEDKTQLQAVHEISMAAQDSLPPGLVLEQHLHPVQAWFVLPLFAFFNAGVHLDGAIGDTIMNPISFGIILGLFVGKQAGIMALCWMAIKMKWAELPDGVAWMHLWGVSILGGIGFTMSLFVAELAFDTRELISEAKIGILIASLMAAIAGYLVLRFSLPKPANAK